MICLHGSRYVMIWDPRVPFKSMGEQTSCLETAPVPPDHPCRSGNKRPGERLYTPFDHDDYNSRGHRDPASNEHSGQGTLLASEDKRRVETVIMLLSPTLPPTQRPTSFDPCTLISLHLHPLMSCDVRLGLLHVNAVPRWRVACGPQLKMSHHLQVGLLPTAHLIRWCSSTCIRISRAQRFSLGVGPCHSLSNVIMICIILPGLDPAPVDQGWPDGTTPSKQ